MPGLVIQGANIHTTVGDIGRAVVYDLRRAMALKRFTDRFTSAQLVTAYGGTTAEWDVVKSAVAELNSINTTFQANRTFIDQVAGLGDI